MQPASILFREKSALLLFRGDWREGGLSDGRFEAAREGAGTVLFPDPGAGSTGTFIL